MHANMRYNIEIEHDDCICFLDLNLHRSSNEIVIGIHRKATYTDLIIPATSNHQEQHKKSAFKYMLDRVNLLPLSREEKLKDINVINTIAVNNGCEEKTLRRINKKVNNDTSRLRRLHDFPKENRKIWTKFTYLEKKSEHSQKF